MRWLFLFCIPAAMASGREMYVSGGAGDGGDGSKAKPFRSIAHALTAAAAGDAILVAAGVYESVDLPLKPKVALRGGYEPRFWRRDHESHRTVLDAKQRGRVLACADGAELEGFVIRNGRVRGHGGAVLCDGVSPVFRSNTFTHNETLGPRPWNPKHIHEDAHDGGAVACLNGCRAVIENNLFVRNSTENGRGGALAVTRSAPRVVGNVFLENDSGLADPMRSSDGGAVSFYDRSSGEFSGNMVIRNRSLNRNDGGGVFVALWSAPRIERNVFAGNHGGDDAGGLFIGGQKHHYDTPLDPLPPADKFNVLVIANTFSGNRNSSMNSGAFRITMESRAVFKGNVIADNAAYFQRSEMEIAGNTFLHDVLFTETKAGLKPPLFTGNYFARPMKIDVPAEVKGSLSRKDGGPKAIEPAMTLFAAAAAFRPDSYDTELKLEKPLEMAVKPGRVVEAGGDHTVVRESRDDRLILWGDLSRARAVEVLPVLAAGEAAAPQAPAAAAKTAPAWTPRRINKAIELLESGQPIYYATAYGGYEEGRKLAKTWADYITYDMEHAPLDFRLLREFMRGLIEGGPAPSGHRTPAVIVVLPALGLDAVSMQANGWMVQQALAQGVHGVHLGRARDPEAVKRYVQAARYPFHKAGADVIGIGTRGWGSQNWPAEVWGVDQKTYLEIADVWPLNPKGEIMLGLKIEDWQALSKAGQTLAVPGIAFAEHGPRDMGLSYGYLEGRADPPVPKEVDEAGRQVMELCRKYGLAFLDNVLPENVERRIDEGVKIGAGRRQDAAEKGRKYTRRQMPW